MVEDVILQQAWVVGIFRSADEAGREAAMIGASLPVAALSGPSVRQLDDSDWRDSYKRHFRAWQFGRLHWVPVWERETYALPNGDAALWLDPGLAFGTGNHETTRLCVERLVAEAERRGSQGRVVDAGCGSGILALSAVRLGFQNVSGFDNDPEAVRVSEDNAKLNGLAGKVPFTVADLVSGLSGVQADVLLANILAHVLIRFRDQLTGAIAPGGTLVLSGILAVERDVVMMRFKQARPDWAFETRTLGEWCDIVLSRPRQ